MPGPQEFLDELSRRGLVDAEVLDRLRRSVRYGEVRDPGELAELLVDQKLISLRDAERLLEATYSFRANPPESNAIDEDEPMLLLLDDDDSTLSADDQADANDSGDDRANDGGVEVGLVGDGMHPTAEAGTAAAEPLAELPQASDAPDRAPRTPRRKHLKKAKSNEFDSPLFLLGAGALVLLTLGGAALFYILNRGSGDELFRAADEAYQAGSLSQAITDYQRFLEGYPAHASASSAKVRLAIARLRQSVETTGDYERALGLAESEVGAVEDEPAFAEGHGDLASLLPKIAEGLAKRAEDAAFGDDPPSAAPWVERTERAMAMVASAKYVPKSLRDEKQLAAVRETLERVGQRREAFQELQKTLQAMREATAAGDPRKAYQLRSRLAELRPEVASEPALAEAVAAAAEAERESIRFIQERAPGIAEAPESPVQVSVALANRRRRGAAEAAGQFVTIHGGVAYAADAADGALLWRRVLGVSTIAADPVPIGGDWLLIDAARGELVRVRGESGELVWRAALGAEAQPPVVVGARAIVALSSGRLLSIDAQSGERLGYAEFAQALRTPPVASDDGKSLYLAGEHSSLYSLDAQSLACRAVAFTGHAAGGVLSPPLIVAGKLVLVENAGLETTRVRLLDLVPTAGGGAAKDIGGELAEQRLDGTTSSPAAASGRRVAVVTDRGAAAIYEVALDTQRKPLTPLASRPAGKQPAPRRVALVGGQLWIADTGLTRSVASLSDSRLVVETLDEPFQRDSFAAPIEVRGGVVMHARRRRGAAGVTLGASDAKTGAAIWETDVAVGPLAAPRVLSQPRGVLEVGVDGSAHLVGPDAIQRGVSDTPDEAPPGGDGLLAAALVVSDGRTVLYRPGAEGFYALAPGVRPSWAPLPGALACRPTPMGRGLIAPLSLGQVLLVDAGGNSLAAPFQPPLTPGRQVAWRPAVVGVVGGKTVALLPEGQGTVRFVTLDESGPDPRLVLQGEQKLETPLALSDAPEQPVAAIAADRGVVGLTQGRVAVLDFGDSEARRVVDVGGEIAWGPYEAGALALLATAADELVAIDPRGEVSIAWRVPLEGGRPIDQPLLGQGAAERSATLALARGVIVRFDLATGESLAQIDVAEALSAGPSRNRDRLLLAANDGTVLVVPAP